MRLLGWIPYYIPFWKTVKTNTPRCFWCHDALSPKAPVLWHSKQMWQSRLHTNVNPNTSMACAGLLTWVFVAQQWYKYQILMCWLIYFFTVWHDTSPWHKKSISAHISKWPKSYCLYVCYYALSTPMNIICILFNARMGPWLGNKTYTILFYWLLAC